MRRKTPTTGGTGGITGRGLMQGVQKLFYLPEGHTDFIYAVISEELGPRLGRGLSKSAQFG